MFWKRKADATPTPTDVSSGPASGRPDNPGEGSDSAHELRDLDVAIDTVVTLLRTFGEHAFDTESVPAEQTRSESDGWARKIAPSQTP